MAGLNLEWYSAIEFDLRFGLIELKETVEVSALLSATLVL